MKRNGICNDNRKKGPIIRDKSINLTLNGKVNEQRTIEDSNTREILTWHLIMYIRFEQFVLTSMKIGATVWQNEIEENNKYLNNNYLVICCV